MERRVCYSKSEDYWGKAELPEGKSSVRSRAWSKTARARRVNKILTKKQTSCKVEKGRDRDFSGRSDQVRV